MCMRETDLMLEEFISDIVPHLQDIILFDMDMLYDTTLRLANIKKTGGYDTLGTRFKQRYRLLCEENINNVVLTVSV